MIKTIHELPSIAGEEFWLGAKTALPLEDVHYIGPFGGLQMTYTILRDPTREPPLDDVVGYLNDNGTWTINGQDYSDFWLA